MNIDPIVVVDTSEIHAGRLDEVKAVMEDLVDFVEANEPRVMIYQVHFAEDGRMTVLQVHPDSESVEYHMELAAPIFARLIGMLTLTAMNVYGQPSATLLERLRAKTGSLGTATVTVHALHAGFAKL